MMSFGFVSRPWLVAAIATALVGTACAAKNPGATAGGTTGSVPATTAARSVALTGTVNAPANIVAQGGGNIVASGGGNIVAQGGGNFVGHNGSAIVAQGGGNLTGASRRLEGLGEHQLAGTAVFLFDREGKQIARTETNDKGEFSFPATSGRAYKVVAAGNQDGKLAQLVTIAKAGDGRADVTTASTCVAMECLAKAAGQLKGWDVNRFQSLVTACNTWLQKSDEPDLTNPGGISSWMEKNGSADLLQRMGAYANDMMQQAQDAFAEAQQQVADAQKTAADAQASAAAAVDFANSLLGGH